MLEMSNEPWWRVREAISSAITRCSRRTPATTAASSCRRRRARLRAPMTSPRRCEAVPR
jgi:hypothetical protein